jgi:N5-hydroxy-L-ornithine N5-transacylase
MPASTLVELANTPEKPALKLPHPYFTPYNVKLSPQSSNGHKLFQITAGSATSSTPLPEVLDNASLHFGELISLDSSARPPESINSPWGRARRSPATTIAWNSPSAPTTGQLWLVIYLLLTVRPDLETFRVRLQGTDHAAVARSLIDVGLAIAHPRPESGSGSTTPAGGATSSPSGNSAATAAEADELLILRGNFWQGAGSPFGARPVWAPEPRPEAARPLAAFPLLPLDHTLTVRREPIPVRAWHPRRPQKPSPGAVIYSRFVPHLGEMFSMVALDYTDPVHLGLFHEWQNDPRVSQGWNETGTLEQHREYLRKAHEDPHQLTVLAQFDGVNFAYFEIYWAKVRSCLDLAAGNRF